MPLICVGAATAAAETRIGLRTLWLPSDHTSWPARRLPKAASVRVNATVYVWVAPAAIVNEVGLTTAVNPAGAVSAAVYVAAEEPTFVTVRVTVWMPVRPPMAIDGWFRSLALMRRQLPPDAAPAPAGTPASH